MQSIRAPARCEYLTVRQRVSDLSPSSGDPVANELPVSAQALGSRADTCSAPGLWGKVGPRSWGDGPKEPLSTRFFLHGSSFAQQPLWRNHLARLRDRLSPWWGADERPGGRCPAGAAKPSLRELLLGQPGDFTRALHLLRRQGGDRPFGGVGHALLRFYHKALRALHRSSCAHFGVLLRSCLWFGRGESQQSIYEWHTARQALETNSRITASNVSARELESITSCLCMGETLGIERQKRGQLSL